MEKRSTLLTKLWDFRYVILTWMFLSTVGAVVWNHFRPPLYSSTVHLFIEDKLAEREHLSGQFKYQAPNVRKVFHLATSTQLLDHLIKKFDLATRFGIQDKTSFGKDRMRMRLAKNIDVHMLDPNSIAVTVRGKDRALVTRMANEICVELDRITEKQGIDDLTRTVRLYDRVLNGLERGSLQQERRLIRVLDSVRTSLSSVDYDPQVDIQLSRLIGDLAANERDLANARKTHQMASMLMRKEHLSSIILLKRAMQDVDTDPLGSMLRRVFTTVSISTVLLVLLLCFWFRNQLEFLAHLEDLNRIPQGALQLRDRGHFNERSIADLKEYPAELEKEPG